MSAGEVAGGAGRARGARDRDREFADWFARVEGVAAAALMAAGFRRHHRSEWRRQHMSRRVQTTRSNPAPAPAPFDPGEAAALLNRARAGDASCVPALRSMFANAEDKSLLDACGSPAAWLENELARTAAGENLAIREASLLKLAAVRGDLEGPAPSPIERLLAERAALCWWIVHRFESASLKPDDNPTIRQAEYHQHRVDGAHARFLSALKTLATVRKLALPAPPGQHRDPPVEHAPVDRGVTAESISRRPTPTGRLLGPSVRSPIAGSGASVRRSSFLTPG